MVLEQAIRCPQCQKHLKVKADGDSTAPVLASPFHVEGTIRPPDGETWEYNLLVVIRDLQGAEVSRKLVEVGAILPGDARTFSLSVEVLPVRGRR